MRLHPVGKQEVVFLQQSERINGKTEVARNQYEISNFFAHREGQTKGIYEEIRG